MRDIEFIAWDKNLKEFMYSKEEGLESFFAFITNITGEIETGDYELFQWTGLKDKNGEKVFEGSIVKDNWGAMGVTTWFHNRFYHKGCDDYSFTAVEVIGHIKTNPELLKE